MILENDRYKQHYYRGLCLVIFFFPLDHASVEFLDSYWKILLALGLWCRMFLMFISSLYWKQKASELFSCNSTLVLGRKEKIYLLKVKYLFWPE